MSQTKSSNFVCKLVCARSIAKGGQWEGVEARGGARLSPVTFPDPPHALLPTHVSLQKKSQDLVCAHHLWTSLYVFYAGALT